MSTLVLLGKTASGKTTTAKFLEELGFRRIITDTTRPIRDGETDGVDYNFLTEDRFLRRRKAGKYAEWTEYNASFGHCYYGSPKKAYNAKFSRNVIVLNPYGLHMVSKNVRADDYVSVYIDVREDMLLPRLKKRGDSDEEIKRRLERDRIDFKDAEDFCDRTVHVEQGMSPSQVAGLVVAEWSSALREKKIR